MAAQPKKKTSKKSKKLSRKTIIIFMAVLWGSIFLGIGSMFFLFNYVAQGGFGDLPTFDELENPETSLATVVYTADGVEIGKYYSENRTNVTFKQLSPNLVNALIATEDARYYNHSGIDQRALIRIVVKTALLRDTGSGGGSTISQQLAKNLFHDLPRNTIDRIKQKLKEWVIAVRLENRYTKEEIIQMYLNTVEFSNNAYGIYSASRTYFNTTPDSLTVPQAAVLVGMLKAPTAYSPTRNPEASKARRNVVMAQMHKYGYLSEENYKCYVQEPIQLNFAVTSHVTGLAPYFREHLRLFLRNWMNDDPDAQIDENKHYNIYTDGLKIYTTLDSRMQNYAEQAVKKNLQELQPEFFEHIGYRTNKLGRDPWDKNKETKKAWNNAVKNCEHYRQLKAKGMPEDSIMMIMEKPVEMTVFSWDGEKDTVMSPIDSIRYHRLHLQNAFLAVNPQTGHIKAWVGGINYKYFKFDHVLSRRQIGSTFKPFVYATAVDNGYSPCLKVRDEQVTFPDFDNWTPENHSREFTDTLMTLFQCLAESKNSCSAYLMKQIGPEPIINLARNLGIESDIPPYPSIALGTPEISLYEMIGAYTAFANKGVRTKPVFVTRIEDKNGNLIDEFIPEREEVLGEELAYIMQQMLKKVIDEGTGYRLRSGNYPFELEADIAGKTGTTDDHADGWFIAFTPELLAGAWGGCDDRFLAFTDIKRGQGASMALPTWGHFFRAIYDDTTLTYDETLEFGEPAFDLSIELDCSKYEQQNTPDVPTYEQLPGYQQ